MYKDKNVEKVIYKKLSYEIMGAVFEVYNELGYGLRKDIMKMLLRKNLIEIK